MNNLINDQWIPVVRQDGMLDTIAPWQMGETDNPVIDIDAPRPDFQGALYQFLIGLLQTAIAPDDIDDWHELYEQSMATAELKQALNKLSDGFNLYCPAAPAFLQDFDLPDAEQKPIAALLIETPGGKTVKDNLDHFVKRDMHQQMCPTCAATALLTLQLNAPAGGVGHRVSLRGGGPLTTLVKPNEPNTTLWHKIWLNVLDQEMSGFDNAKVDAQVLPWLAATRLSDKKGVTTTPADVHPLQMYWAMPRRIRLAAHCSNDNGCDTCGKTAAHYFTHFMTKNYGVNYDGGWLHPLTPYSFDVKKQKLPLSIKGQQGGLSYRHWLSLILHDEQSGGRSAKIVNAFVNGRASYLAASLDVLPVAQLWCFGYDMDNMKARCWYEHHMPMFALDDKKRANLQRWCEQMLLCGRDSVFLLRKFIKEAWVSRPGDVKGDMLHITSEFWQQSESLFYQLLADMVVMPADTQFPHSVYQQWLKALFIQVLNAFDRWTLAQATAEIDLKRIVLAKEQLKRKFGGQKSIKVMKQNSIESKPNNNTTGEQA